jgi:hypothetical protein
MSGRVYESQARHRLEEPLTDVQRRLRDRVVGTSSRISDWLWALNQVRKNSQVATEDADRVMVWLFANSGERWQ